VLTSGSKLKTGAVTAFYPQKSNYSGTSLRGGTIAEAISPIVKETASQKRLAVTCNKEAE